jgi:general L-amino acid transport system substrate-binding protein
MRRWNSLLLAATLSVATLAGCTLTSPTGKDDSPAASGAPSAAGAPSRLDTIISRGKLICGVEGTITGFSFVDSNGKYSGLDVDVCKAVAAAIFGDPEKVEFRNLDSTARFPAVTSGEVDICLGTRPGRLAGMLRVVMAWNLRRRPFLMDRA